MADGAFRRGIRALRQFGRLAGHVWRRLGEERVAEAAAGMAYYGFFSLFPALLLLVVAIGALLESAQAQEQVLQVLTRVFPFSGEVIERSIQQVLRSRGPVGAWSGLALAWSGSGVFHNLARNVNRAWPQADVRPFYIRRFMAFIILLVMLVVAALLVAVNVLMQWLPAEVNGLAQVLVGMRYFTQSVAGLMVFLTLFMLYRWLPNTRVPWRAGFWGALVAASAAEGITLAFSWYVRTGFANYNLVYGSLGAVAALLFWIYLLAFMVLLGAHLAAALGGAFPDLE